MLSGVDNNLTHERVFVFGYVRVCVCMYVCIPCLMGSGSEACPLPVREGERDYLIGNGTLSHVFFQG